MAELKDVKKLMTLLGLKEDMAAGKEEYCLFVLEQAEDMVKNYCHIQQMPKTLKNIWFSMAMELYRAILPGQTECIGAVKAIREGELSLSFQEGGSDYPSATLLKNYSGLTFLRNYTEQLNGFRRFG